MQIKKLSLTDWALENSKGQHLGWITKEGKNCFLIKNNSNTVFEFSQSFKEAKQKAINLIN